MSLSVDQIREIIVGDAVAAETTLATFQASASPLEIAVVSADGTAPGVGKPFYVVTKAADGTLIKSDIVYPDSVKRVEGVAYKAEVAKSVAITDIEVPATTGDKQEYMVDIRMFNVGSLSVANWHLFHGHTIFTKTATNGAEDVVDALISNLNQNFSKIAGATSTTNPFFTFGKSHTTQTLTVTTEPTADGTATVTINGDAISVALLNVDTAAGTATKIAAAIDGHADYVATAAGSDVTITAANGDPVSTSYAGGTSGSAATVDGPDAEAALVITAKIQDAEQGKKFGRGLEFDVALKSDLNSTVTVITPAFPGVGTGKKVAEMEWFLRGFRGDSLRGTSYPFTWASGTKSLSDPSGTYNVVEVIHIPKGDGLNVIQARKELTIAIGEAPGTVTDRDALIADINTFIG